MADIKYDEVVAAIRSFELEAKTERVFSPNDPVFEMKCRSFMSCARGIAQSVTDNSITIADKTLCDGVAKIESYTITANDVLAIFDNTKIGFFGNIAKKDCEAGMLVTKQGFLVYNNPDDGVSRHSGFISWGTMSSAYVGGDGFVMGIVLYKNHKKRPALNGPQVAFIFENAASKILKDKLMLLFGHFRLISRGRGLEFNPDDWSAEAADECVLCEEVDECVPEDIVDE